MDEDIQHKYFEVRRLEKLPKSEAGDVSKPKDFYLRLFNVWAHEIYNDWLQGQLVDIEHDRRIAPGLFWSKLCSAALNVIPPSQTRIKDAHVIDLTNE